MPVRLLPRFAWLGLGLLLTAASGAAAGFIEDSTRALTAAKKAELEQEMAAFEAETGVRLGIKTVAYLDPGVSMRTTVRQARQALAAEGPVALILVDRGKNGLGISHSPELWQRYPLARLVEVLQRVLTRAEADSQQGIEKALLIAAKQWMADLRQLEKERQNAARLLQGPDQALLLGCALLFVGGGFGLRSLVTRRRRREVTDRRQFLFPDVVVGQRLGAPFGGGHLADWESGIPTETGPASRG